MSILNIVSTDATLSRIVELEASRLGMDVKGSSAPLADAAVYLIDLDTCEDAPVPENAATVLLLRENGKEEAPAEGRGHVAAYLTKPFLLDELRFILTHLAPSAQPLILPERSAAKRLRTRRDSIGTRLIIDHRARTASLSGSDPVKLSETEYKLLCLLYEHKNQPVSAEMASAVLGNTDSNKYNVYICYLRRKLERGALRLIRTVRGKGYMLQVK